MKATWLIPVVCSLVLITMGLGQQRNSGKTPTAVQTMGASNGRYQLLAAEVESQDQSGSDFATHEVFLLDTQTGSMWRFQSRFVYQQNGKSVFTSDKMIPVGFDQADSN